jgi:hypothetical protein
MTEKKKCPECGIEFTPTRWWQEFCCTKHRQDFHNRNYREAEYRTKVEMAERGLNGHTNGHAAGEASERKITLTELGLAPPKPQIKRRKLTAHDAGERAT